MNTRRINPSEIEGMEVLATGYKIFNDDWTGHGGYAYADKDGMTRLFSKQLRRASE